MTTYKLEITKIIKYEYRIANNNKISIVSNKNHTSSFSISASGRIASPSNARRLSIGTCWEMVCRALLNKTFCCLDHRVSFA